MSGARILAGTCVRQHPEVLAAHLESMRTQRAHPHAPFTVDLAYVDDNDDDAASAILRGAARTLPAGARDEDDRYAVAEHTHAWSVPAFHRLAHEKQRLLDLAVAEGYDYIWLVDSDLLCAPDTLASALACGRDVVSSVFYTSWTAGDAPLPQVWTRHPYGFDGDGCSEEDFLGALAKRALVPVRGLGACTLIATPALRRGLGFWPLLEGLPAHGMWQGEDRHFCVRAAALHTPLFADAWPEVWHAYRPSQRTELDAQLARLAAAPRERIESPSDWVSLSIEALGEPRLVGHVEHVRAPVYALGVLDEIVRTAHDLRVGDAAFVRARLPAHWPIAAGARATLRVRLLGVYDRAHVAPR